jgi:hypothetical protein
MTTFRSSGETEVEVLVSRRELAMRAEHYAAALIAIVGQPVHFQCLFCGSATRQPWNEQHLASCPWLIAARALGVA